MIFRLVVSLSRDEDAKRQYSMRGQLFNAVVADRQIVTRSPVPMLDAG